MAATYRLPATQLEEQGYVVVKSALSKCLLAELREVIEQSPIGVTSISAEHRYNDRYQGDHLYIGFSDADMDRAGATRHDAYARLVSSPGLADALEGAGLRSVKYWTGSVMSKPPGGPPLYWHHDWAFFDHPLSQQAAGCQIFAMVYLADTTPANGCLRVLPGSHFKRLPLHDELAHLMKQGEGPAHGGWGQSSPWELKGKTSALFCDPPGAVDVCVEAGSVVIGDSRLLHATHPNNSAQRRTGLTLWFIADWDNLTQPFQKYWAQGAKPSCQNQPVSPVAWRLLEHLVPPLPDAHTQAQTPMLDWQGGGPHGGPRGVPLQSTARHATASPTAPTETSSAMMHAKVTCTCGECELTFFNPQPRNHSECCCWDCRQKLEWAAAQQHSLFTPQVSNLYYLDDDIIAIKGEEHLSEFLLREPSGAVVPGTDTPVTSPFIVATCCYSVLCVPATYYNNNYVAIIAESCSLQCAPMVAQIRYAIDEFPTNFASALPPYGGVGVQLPKHLFHCESSPV